MTKHEIKLIRLEKHCLKVKHALVNQFKVANIDSQWQRSDCGLSGGTQKNVKCPMGYTTAKSLRTTTLAARITV